MYNIINARQKCTTTLLTFIKRDPSLIISQARPNLFHNSVRNLGLSKCLCSAYNILQCRHSLRNDNNVCNYRHPQGIPDLFRYRNLSSEKSGNDHSSSDDGDDTSKNRQPSPPEASENDDILPSHQSLPANIVVPEVYPFVPLIAVNRNPVFPRFIKLLEVSRAEFCK